MYILCLYIARIIYSTGLNSLSTESQRTLQDWQVVHFRCRHPDSQGIHHRRSRPCHVARARGRSRESHHLSQWHRDKQP